VRLKAKEGHAMKKGETMGERMARLRKAAGLSQPQLAKKSGVPLGTLRCLEQDRRIPRLDTFIALADAIGCTLDELAGRGSAAAPSETTPPKRKGKK
jgi:HTH-type transcriptional regulator, cell division transcriptional repressor